ncbi:MAG TPA: hypothetical protein VFP27_05530, partial [Mycobacterium sp.]|nr:hypothetical protein [Mycobacterium sp.]
MPVSLGPLPTLNKQADRLISLGIHQLSGLSPTQIFTAVSETDADNALLVVHPDRVSASVLAPFL